MQLKKPIKVLNRRQLPYRRAFTTPCYAHSTLPTRFPVKTIKSLNFYCLSEIFQYLDYRDLVNFRLVCSFWKECVDFHLAQRSHFSYGKLYNNEKQSAINLTKTSIKNITENDRKKSKDSNTETSIYIDTSYLCEKCIALNKKILLNCVDEDVKSPVSRVSNNLMSTEQCLKSKNTDVDDQTPIESSPTEDNQIIKFCDKMILCYDCQEIVKNLNENKLDSNQSQDFGNLNGGLIDQINMNNLEKILSKMPKLKTLKYAQGYRYGRLQQTCLEVSKANLIEQTFKYCPNLVRIDLSNCIGLTEKDFYQLVERYGRQLVSLNVSGCRIDESCLRAIVKGFDKLRYLNISNNFCRLRAGCFEWIADTIETIVADYNQNVRALDGLIQGKGRNIIELELNVGYCFNPSMPYKLIGKHFQNLISLKIIFKSFGQHQNGIFVDLCKLPELECLYLIEEIDDFESKSSLDNHSVLTILKSCGLKLRELYLHAASSLFGGSSSLTDEALDQIDQLCPLLEVLSIKRACITDKSLEAISRLKNAYTVELIDLENISNHGVKRIMRSFKEIEKQQAEQIKNACGVDISFGNDSGPKVQTVKR